MADAPKIAVNRKTGERLMQVDGLWYPMGPGTFASNPKTGERLFLAGDRWVPIPPDIKDKKAAAPDSPGGSPAAKLMSRIALARATAANPVVGLGSALAKPSMLSELGKGVPRGLGLLAQYPDRYGIQLGSQVASEARGKLGAIGDVESGKLKPLSPSDLKAMKFAGTLAQQSMAAQMGILDPSALAATGMPPPVPSELEAASRYAAATPQEKAATKQALTKEASEANTRVAERVAKVREAEAELQAKYPAAVPEFTSIRSMDDALMWLAGSAGEALPQLIPTMVTAVATRSPMAIGAVSGAMTIPQEVDARVESILEQTKDKPAEERMSALTDYVANNFGVSALVSAATGALDAVAGPTATLSKGLLTKLGMKGAKDVVARSIKQAIVQGAKRLPKEVAEEVLTGSAQEIASITGARTLGEQGEDPALSAENIKRVLNAGAAEGAGGFAGAVVNTGLDAAVSKLRGREDTSASALELGAQLSGQLDQLYTGVAPDVAEIYGKIAADRIAATTLENKALTRQDAADLVGEQHEVMLKYALDQANAKRATNKQPPADAPVPIPRDAAPAAAPNTATGLSAGPGGAGGTQTAGATPPTPPPPGVPPAGVGGVPGSNGPPPNGADTSGVGGNKPPDDTSQAGGAGGSGLLKGGAAEALAPYRQEIAAKLQNPETETFKVLNSLFSAIKGGIKPERLDSFMTTASAVLQLVDTATDPMELAAVIAKYGALPRTFAGEINRDALVAKIAEVELTPKKRGKTAQAAQSESLDDTLGGDKVPNFEGETPPPEKNLSDMSREERAAMDEAPADETPSALTSEQLEERVPDVDKKDLQNLLSAKAVGTKGVSFDDRLQKVVDSIMEHTDEDEAVRGSVSTALKRAIKGAIDTIASGGRGIDFLTENYKQLVANELAKNNQQLAEPSTDVERRGTQTKQREVWENEASLSKIEAHILEAEKARARAPLTVTSVAPANKAADEEVSPEDLLGDLRITLSDGTTVNLERDELTGNYFAVDNLGEMDRGEVKKDKKTGKKVPVRSKLSRADAERLMVSTPHVWGEAGSEQDLEDLDTSENGLGQEYNDALEEALPGYIYRQRMRFLAARNDLRSQRQAASIKPQAPEGETETPKLQTEGTLAEFEADAVDEAMDNEPIPNKPPPPVLKGGKATAQDYGKLMDRLKPYLQDRYDELRRLMDDALAGKTSLTPADAATLAAKIARANYDFSQTPEGMAVKQELGSFFAAETARQQRIPSLTRRIDMLIRRFDMGKISAEEFTAELISARRANLLDKAAKPAPNRQRGANIIREKMLNAVRQGAMSQEAYDFLDWLIRQNEDVAQDLAISIRTPRSAAITVGGTYTPLARLISLFKGSADDDTAVHEIMHHTETMMPEPVRNAVRRSWERSLAAAKKKHSSNPEAITFFTLAEAGDSSSAQEWLTGAASLPIEEFYQYSSPSEFWAVNATDILRGRYEARGSVLQRARQFIRELSEHLKAAFNMPSSSALIRALNSILRGTGVYERQVMLDMSATTLRQAKPNAGTGKRPRKLRDVQKRILASQVAQSPEDIRKLAKDVEKLSGKKVMGNDDRKLLSKLWDDQPVVTQNAILNSIPTRDTVAMFKRDIPHMAGLWGLVDQVIAFRTRILRETNAVVKTWQGLIDKYPEGAKALSQLIVQADVLNFNPLEYKNKKEALARDTVLKEAKAAGNSAAVTSRTYAIEAFYTGDTSPEGIRIYGWDELSKPKLGGGLAKLVFRNSQKEQAALFRVKTDSMLANAARLTSNSLYAAQLAKQLTDRIMKAREKKVFSPLMRFGQYWVNIKDHKGFKGGLFSFEDKKQRDYFLATKRLQYEHEGLPLDLITEGNSLAELRNIMANRSMRQAFDKIMELVDNLDIMSANSPGAVAAAGKGALTKEDVKNEITELFLETLSDSDYYKMFKHRKYTPGFNLDALRVFIANQTKQANQLARLKYQSEIDLLHAEAIKSLEGKPRSAALKTVVDHVYREVSGLSSGTPPISPMVTIAGRVVFAYLLTSIRTAVINTTQTAYSFAYMLAKYGAGATGVVAKNLLSMVNPVSPGLGMEVYDASGRLETEWGEASYINSIKHRDMKATNPDLYDCLDAAWHHGNDLERFTGEVSRDLYARSRTPSDRFGLGVLKRGTLSERITGGTSYAARKAVDALGFAFHHMERLTREGTYITCAELAYKKAKKEGASHEEAKAKAIAAADDMSLETLGDTSTLGRPPVLTRSNAGRLLGALAWYAIFTAGFTTKNIYRLTDKESRKLAIALLTAQTGMTFLFAGVTGLPLYGVSMMAIDLVRKTFAALGDEEDDPPYEDVDGNPVAGYNADLEFRTSILPKILGPNSGMANFFRWSEKTAKGVVRGAKYGPISSLTDANFSNSMSLAGLVHTPSGVDEARNMSEALEAFGVADLAPIGSVATRITRGVDYALKGDNQRALENFLPGVLSDFLKAARFEKYGFLTPQNLPIKEKEFYDKGKLAAQRMGLGSTEAYEKQQEQFILPIKTQREIAAKKSALTQAYSAAVFLYNTDPSEENIARLEKVRAKMRKFNRQFSPYAIDIAKEEKDAVDYMTERNTIRTTGVPDLEKVLPVAPGLSTYRQE